MVEKNNKKKPRADRWYLKLMAPNTRGSDFAWLDPTPVYLNQAAFNQLLDDLIKDITDFDTVSYTHLTLPTTPYV